MTTELAEGPISAVDRIPAAGPLLMYALQHVLVMYAGAVTVPLVMGRALHLDPHDLTLLVCADLIAAGVATLIQTLGLGAVGIRLPIMMGVTFVSLSRCWRSSARRPIRWRRAWRCCR